MNNVWMYIGVRYHLNLLLQYLILVSVFKQIAHLFLFFSFFCHYFTNYDIWHYLPELIFFANKFTQIWCTNEPKLMSLLSASLLHLNCSSMSEN